ncbi:PH domain-containing protein [Salinactinospora qingdaonensis]|uniref:PH domain-containing protein n=1 Tax=Salinactinospora qingdaonensis TaxID=702744 RepID=UPI0031F15221
MKPLTRPLPRVLGWCWLGLVALNLLDLALRGRTSAALVAGAVLLASAGVAYVVALRPKLTPTEAGVWLVNPLRDVFVPWSALTWVDVTDVLRVHTDGRVFRSWPLRESRPAKVRDNLRSVEAGMTQPPEDTADRADAAAASRPPRPVDAMAQWLREEAQRRKAQPPAGRPEGGVSGGAEADGGAPTHPGSEAGGEPAPRWAPDALAALLVPAVLLVAALLLA